MQSYLQLKTNIDADVISDKRPMKFPALSNIDGAMSRLRHKRLLFIYAVLFAIGTLFVFGMSAAPAQAFGLGLIFPGGGFMLDWNSTAPHMTMTMTLTMFFGTLFLLAVSVVLWFATGNVIFPPLVWIVSAGMAAHWHRFTGPVDTFGNSAIWVLFACIPCAIITFSIAHKASRHFGQLRRDQLNTYLLNPSSPIPKPAQLSQPRSTPNDELSLSELSHMRLLLDRALQPAANFDGFEWIDQFQTSAVRYQINFISYALSLAQANYMPAFSGYLSTAQQNLKAKQENPRIWKYWGLENFWGNLRLDTDPIKRDNIMYSGFVAAQLALAANAGVPHDVKKFDGLNCRAGNKPGFAYSQTDIIKTLVSQYNTAGYGLLSCEPNWVYPLCNAITATAIRAYDSAHGTRYWDEIKYAFTHALETEFITAGGKLIPFRSNYTGLAAPGIGGAVMQAFPCFFLSAALPEIAERQWLALRHDMQNKSWRRALWPIDVGNYKYSRASSYAATALAAREMGDDETANLLLQYLDNDNPVLISGGVAHHSKTSLWANANAFMAKTGRANGLRDLVTTPQNRTLSAPYLASADYGEVLIAKARTDGEVLDITLYPVGLSGMKTLEISGLQPDAPYRLNTGGTQAFHADHNGTRTLHIPMNGRTSLQISRVQ